MANNKKQEIPTEVLAAYNFYDDSKSNNNNTNNNKGLHPVRVVLFGNGLINATWQVTDKTNNNKYIFQRINHKVFRKPEDIAHNIRLMGEHLRMHHPQYKFTFPVLTTDGRDMLCVDHRKNNNNNNNNNNNTDLDIGYYRCFEYVPHSVAVDVVQDAAQAREVASAFGRYTRLLQGLPVEQLKVTLPHFHDLELRYKQFMEAVEGGNNNNNSNNTTNKARVKECEPYIHQLKELAPTILGMYTAMVRDAQQHHYKRRVTHHDTKISNVLLHDKTGKSLCVIDLDTTMPGYYISDVGDMMRTYLSPVSEEETDMSKIKIRMDIYKAIKEGYLSEMGELLTPQELAIFDMAGPFMIYMQSLRFFTDYMNNDVYYGRKYEKHNFNRGLNQLTLLVRLMECLEKEKKNNNNSKSKL